ncbi:MAG: site-specific integrase [Firmicutes bacterium]|nr:site-specific integrase [Candidatus Fiminaster equi]
MEEQWNLQVSKPKVESLPPHSLRFTYITRMRRNCDGEIVQKLADHNSMEMTEYYTRAAIPEMVEAAKPAIDAANKLFA